MAAQPGQNQFYVTPSPGLYSSDDFALHMLSSKGTMMNMTISVLKKAVSSG